LERQHPNPDHQHESTPCPKRQSRKRKRAGVSYLCWQQRTNGENPRDYLSVKLDDPSLPEAISAALFEATDGKEAQLVWSRRRSAEH
jgi:uncharacterized protein (DUF736 family)